MYLQPLVRDLLTITDDLSDNPMCLKVELVIHTLAQALILSTQEITICAGQFLYN